MQLRIGDWKTHDFGTFQDLVNKTLNVEAMAMERTTGVPFEDLAKGLAVGMRTSITAFVWILRKREEPTLKFDEIVFAEEELELIITDADKARQEEEARRAKEEAEQGNDQAGPEEPATTLHLPDSETSSDDSSDTSEA